MINGAPCGLVFLLLFIHIDLVLWPADHRKYVKWKCWLLVPPPLPVRQRYSKDTWVPLNWSCYRI